jgi:hypothetical protein
MPIYQYLSIFPMEALISSQLKPMAFGRYMAIGSRKGSHENFMFAAVKGEFGDYFDWEYAKKNCVPHADGQPKHSVYLSVYKVLENIPIEQIGSLYLATRDGEVLELPPGKYTASTEGLGFHVYQELCPISPTVVSKLDPPGFARYLTGGEHKIHVPKIIFADLKVVDFENPERSGNLGGIYDRKVEHLKGCIAEVESKPSKINKTFDRSLSESFSYQVIDRGIYIADREKLCMYAMKSIDELASDYYYWAKSAYII